MKGDRLRMRLTELLQNLEYICVQGSLDTEVRSVVFDSRKADKDSLFICIKGAVSDGHKYAEDVAAIRSA